MMDRAILNLSQTDFNTLKFLVAILTLLLMAHSARAELQIQEPEIEAGEIEFQSVAGWASNAPKRDDLEFTRQSYETEIQMSLTDYLMLEVGIGIEKGLEIEDGERQPSDLKLTELELGIQIELFSVAKHGLGLALVAGFTKAQTLQEDDSINWGAITKLEQGPLSLTSNLYFSDPRTDDATADHVNFEYGVQLKYQLSEMIALAGEAIGEIDNVYNPGDINTQPHRVGPLVYITWKSQEETGGNDVTEEGAGGERDEGETVTFGLGALFGLTDVTADMRIKADLEIEF